MPDFREPHQLTATEAIRLIQDGKLTSREWVASCLDRISSRDPEIRAWATVNGNAIEDSDAQTARGIAATIPVGAKDIIDICGMPTGMGTDFHSPDPVTREGGSISLMREAGCVFMGKAVTTELGHMHPGPTRNPHNTDHTPGGSSSGSAAAVADFMVPVCLGTQTTGSVIRPAAYCGVIGYKPTYNDFDKTHILANAPSMDTLGLMARSVDDIALMRGILVEEPDKPVANIRISDLKFGLLTSSPWDEADDESRGFIEGLAGKLGALGAKITEVRLDREVPRLMELQRTISGYEFKRSIAFERLRHFDSLSKILREGRLADGVRVSASEYQAAIREVASLRLRLADLFNDVDILLFPSADGPAPAGIEATGKPTFNSAWTVAGNPVITLPLFRSSTGGMPIGCQFIAGFANDDMLISAMRKVMESVAPDTVPGA